MTRRYRRLQSWEGSDKFIYGFQSFPPLCLGHLKTISAASVVWCFSPSMPKDTVGSGQGFYCKVPAFNLKQETPCFLDTMPAFTNQLLILARLPLEGLIQAIFSGVYELQHDVPLGFEPNSEMLSSLEVR